MRKFLILVVILVFVFPLQAQFPFNWSEFNWSALNELMQQMTKTHFREVRWGMTQAQIRALEKGEPRGTVHSKSSGLDIIVYEGKAGDLSCNFGYYFAENQLVEGRYMFTEKHANDLLFFADFRNVKESLTKKYGEPTRDKVLWLNDLFKDDSSQWGMALSIGHVVFEVAWRTSQTEIMLRLVGDNYEVTHFVQYTSKIKKHKELVRKAAEKAEKDIW